MLRAYVHDRTAKAYLEGLLSLLLVTLCVSDPKTLRNTEGLGSICAARLLRCWLLRLLCNLQAPGLQQQSIESPRGVRLRRDLQGHITAACQSVDKDQGLQSTVCEHMEETMYVQGSVK